MPWASDYIGLPYAEHGASRNGANCWGLVYLIGHQLGMKLPRMKGVTWRTALRHGNWPGFLAEGKGAGWETLWESAGDNDMPPRGLKVEPGDGVLLSHLGRAAHCGMVVGAPYFIHVIDEIETSLARYDLDPWKRNVVGFYRWTGERC
jgi:cell wall-associated NlpC family hydrolase